MTLLAVSAALAARLPGRSRRASRRRCCRCGSSGCGRSRGPTPSGSCSAAASSRFIFVGTLYMQQVLGYSALQTGLAWLAASVTSVALAGLSQALVTRGSAKPVMALGMALIGGGILWATAGAGARPLLARPRRAVLHRRRGHRIRLHPGLDRGARRYRRARGRPRLRAAQHRAAARRGDRRRDRVHGRDESLHHAAARGRRSRRPR